MGVQPCRWYVLRSSLKMKCIKWGDWVELVENVGGGVLFTK